MARPMTVQDRADFVSVAEAAGRLGVSTNTVKRRIAAGTLEAEQIQRPPGFEYRVRLARDVPAPPTERSDSEPITLTSAAHGTTHDVSAAITAAIAPPATRLIVQDDTIERQAGVVRELERGNGRLSAEPGALRTAHATLTAPQQPTEASGAPESPAPTKTKGHPRLGGVSCGRGEREESGMELLIVFAGATAFVILVLVALEGRRG
jgi:hypothetical protein